ncbi:hypothetical protein [Actinopolymorpha pittospori]|uniref:Uncharacterized protein n=1 Tax=Actinopolymorpha pittospori TaxID=648752 RepID=A0A927RH33_9ACTN|nr:hypothetical protein [Actinopolymorpha pittospori]MBE1604801.1 hypothetical protein [Actinopolymorpha pittospori]
MAEIRLDPHGQEEVHPFCGNLRRAVGPGRDDTLPPLHIASIAMELGGNGEVRPEPLGGEWRP